MTRVSITRLRLRSVWFELPFLWHAVRSQIQGKNAEGCLGVNIRRTNGAYWTLTLWRDTAAMRAFMLSGAHKDAMPKLQDWCSEASLAHWEQDSTGMPTWEEGERHLATEGRVSHVKHPSPAQSAGLTSGSAA